MMIWIITTVRILPGVVNREYKVHQDMRKEEERSWICFCPPEVLCRQPGVPTHLPVIHELKIILIALE